MAWGRLPVLGNVKLIVLSERMVKHHHTTSASSSSSSLGEEKLIVRWKTCPKSHPSNTGASAGIREKPSQDEEEFHGLFVFAFDAKGRVVTHIIEHADEGCEYGDRTARVISVTDWLLGRAWGKKEEDLGLALGCVAEEDGRGRRNGRQ